MFKNLFPQKYPLIGMIHLPPLPGYSNHPGMELVIYKALQDLKVLENAGYSGVLVENGNDQLHQIGVNNQIVNAITVVMENLQIKARVPLGMEIIYDMPKTIEVAGRVGVDFVRLDFFVDGGKTQWGDIQPQAGYLYELKKNLFPNLILLTDIQVKHAEMLTPRSLSESAFEAQKFGSDGIIVTGDWTGQQPKIADLQVVRGMGLKIPVVVGSGMSAENACDLVKVSNAAIVGTSIKSGEFVDENKAAALLETITSCLAIRG